MLGRAALPVGSGVSVSDGKEKFLYQTDISEPLIRGGRGRGRGGVGYLSIYLDGSYRRTNVGVDVLRN